MDILRFITAGSVDDGKSTLIGRLLYDSKSILIDQLRSIEKASNKANGEIDLALLTDGLRAEREQGITIDVAYKYFSTPRRKFIIADAPGHIQYTRNMVTGASNSDLIIILIDARHGVVEQTRRHSIIASLLDVAHVVVAVNKMDLVSYDETVFNTIVNDYKEVAASLGLNEVTYIPIAAITGDNITEHSTKLDWYNGEPLLAFLEQVNIKRSAENNKARLYVQYVIRPQAPGYHDYRGYAGRITGGSLHVGDHVISLPSGISTTISAIESGGNAIDEAYAGQSITIQLADDIDISRGDVIVKKSDLQPIVSQDLEALLCWMDTRPLLPGNRYLLQLNSLTVPAIVKHIGYKVDVNTIDKTHNPATAELNDIVSVTLKTASPVPYDKYTVLHTGGGAILIDETSYATVAAAILQ